MIENHFKAYNEILDKIQAKNMQLIKMKEDWYNISGTNYDDIKVQGVKPLDIADQLHNIVEKEKSLIGLINYKEELRRIHEKEISKIHNSKKRNVLTFYYLDGCSIKEIAGYLEISESYTKKLKKWAVEEFTKKVIMEG